MDEVRNGTNTGLFLKLTENKNSKRKNKISNCSALTVLTYISLLFVSSKIALLFNILQNTRKGVKHISKKSQNTKNN